MRETTSRETIGAMRKAFACLCLTGCSWVFMDKPEDHYAPSTQPQCSTSTAAPIADGVFALLNVAGLLAVAASPDGSIDKTDAYLGGAAWALIHLASMGEGFGWASQCSEAKSDFDRHEARQEAKEEKARERDRREELIRESDRRDEKRKARHVEEPPVPRGFFCSSSPTVADAGLCVRDKAECQRARDAAIVGVADLTECALVERAFCYGDHCAPTVEACTAMRARSVGSDGTAPECADSE
jgi:hypothetical protein